MQDKFVAFSPSLASHSLVYKAITLGRIEVIPIFVEKPLSRHVCYPGICHDSMIFEQSVAHQDMRLGWGWGGVYFGDSAFANTKYMMTKFRKKELSDPVVENAMQKRFNTDVCRLRSVVENAFGNLKAKFPFLRNRMKGISHGFA